MTQPDFLPELYRAGLKASMDMMNACLGGVERLQSYQTEALAEMRASQAEMSKQLGAMRGMEDMQATQVELARSQMTRMTAYWSGLCAAACQNQVELLKDAQGRVQDIADDLGRKLDTAPSGAQPVASALKLVVGAAQSTYAAGVRAAEEMARLTAAQVNTGGSAARQGKAKRVASGRGHGRCGFGCERLC